MLTRAYFVEKSILFRLAGVSTPAIIGLRKAIQKLPDRDEFNEIKMEDDSIMTAAYQELKYALQFKEQTKSY